VVPRPTIVSKRASRLLGDGIWQRAVAYSRGLLTSRAMKRRLALSCLCALSAVSRPAHAQTRPSTAPFTEPSISPISRAAGLASSDGELWGVGDGYKVCFSARGFEFTPAFGARASGNCPITFETISIGRDGAATTLASAPPRQDGLRVEYDRGGVVERYDVGVEHLAQSFVFRVRPAGSGDLVVRGRLSTELSVTADGDGLRFTLPDVGSCTMSGVVGVDARGHRVPGRVHYAAGYVELSLPAAFADGAALPFVLDPLLAGASVVSGSGGPDDRSPAVAYDASNDVFCVVWERIISASDHDVYARFVTRAGVPVGGTLPVDTTTQVATAPQIAGCNARDAFVVVFDRGIDVIGRAVSAATSALGATTAIVSSSMRTESYAFGSVASSLQNSGVLCVWQKTTTSPVADKAVQAAGVGVGASLDLTVGIVHDVARDVRLSRPRVSKSDRGRNRYAIVFQRTSGTRYLDFAMRVIDGSGAPVTSLHTLESSATAPTAPEVDGDGDSWLVAWQTTDFNVPPRQIIMIAALFVDPSTHESVIHRMGRLPDPPVSHGFVEPRVTWITESCLVGFADQTASFRAARVRSVDGTFCSLCEGDFPAGMSTRVEGAPNGCAVRATGGTGEDVLLVWEQALAGNGDIIARRWRAVDGDVTSLGGGCGRGGSNLASCARSPHAFAHVLRDAPALTPTVFLIAASPAGFSCGGCNLLPNLIGAASVVTTTSVNGQAAVGTDLPPASPLIGVPLFTQWATFDPATPACSQFLLNLSNALRVVIES